MEISLKTGNKGTISHSNPTTGHIINITTGKKVFLINNKPFVLGIDCDIVDANQRGWFYVEL